MTERGSSVHAVVWRSPDTPLPTALTEALDAQRISREEAIGPFDALSRLLAARQERGPARVLLLVDPETLADQEDARRTLDRFDPEARCWSFRAKGSPRLGPMPALPKPAEPEIVVRPGAERRTAPPLRLTDPGPRPHKGQEPETTVRSAPDGHQDDPVESRGLGEGQTPRSVLTAEELAMLLADDVP